MNKDSREGLGVLVVVVEVVRPSDFFAFLDGGDAYDDLALSVHGRKKCDAQDTTFCFHSFALYGSYLSSYFGVLS